MHKLVFCFLTKNKCVPSRLRDQLSRASLSVMLLIAEGCGRLTQAYKSHYYTQARASIFETVACLEACYDLGHYSDSELNKSSNEYETISKMLFGLMRKIKKD